ncbi:MAG: cation transporter [Christensenellales bacterium]
MSEGILKLFVKDYKQTDNPAVRSKCAVAAGWVCIACNILLCAAKFVIGVISRSIAIQADAVNNLSDVGSSAGMIFGARRPRQSLRTGSIPTAMRGLNT